LVYFIDYLFIDEFLLDQGPMSHCKEKVVNKEKRK